MDVVDKTGAWFTSGETRLGQGREQAKEFLKGNVDVASGIERQIQLLNQDNIADRQMREHGTISASGQPCA